MWSQVGCRAFRRESPFGDSIDACRQFSQRGLSAMEFGQWPEAESLLRRAVAASPSDAQSRRHLAETLQLRGDKTGALATIEEAARLAPSDADIAILAGSMQLEAGNLEAARTHAARAVANDAQRAEAWSLRARCEVAAGEHPAAIADYHRALGLAPGDTHALIELSQIYADQSEFHRCLTTVQHLVDCYPPGEEPQDALVMEGRCYLALGNPHDAASSLELAATRGARTPALVCAQAETQLALGNGPEALRLAHEASQIEQGNAQAAALIARLTRTESQPVQR